MGGPPLTMGANMHQQLGDCTFSFLWKFLNGPLSGVLIRSFLNLHKSETESSLSSTIALNCGA